MSAKDSTVKSACKLIEVSPELVEQWVLAGDAVLVDVREDFEHASERIENTRLHALSKFDAEQLRQECDRKRVVFHCRTGARSSQAAERFGDEQVFHLQGGIEGWKASGRPVYRSASAPKLDIMRQVQIVAGSLIVIGVVLGTLVNPWFYGISAFVGCGLVFAGLSGWCGMAMLLGKMPWNKIAPVCCTEECSTHKKPELTTDF